MNPFKKVVRLGTTPIGKSNASVFVAIEWDGAKLSLTGVEGPTHGGNARGSCGQIEMHRPQIANVAPGWTQGKIKKLWELWDEWHLNDMQPGCEHQRAGVAAYDGDPSVGVPWDERPIDPTKPTNVYGTHYDGQRYSSGNMLGWVRHDEHPEGLLARPCPVCGYGYGTKWLKKEVPEDVLQWLADLPGADREPAWV